MTTHRLTITMLIACLKDYRDATVVTGPFTDFTRVGIPLGVVTQAIEALEQVEGSSPSTPVRHPTREELA